MKVWRSARSRSQANAENQFNQSPTNAVPVFRYHLYTPLGTLELAWTAKGLRSVSWRRSPPDMTRDHCIPFPVWLDRAIALLRLYAQGHVVRFQGVPIDWSALPAFHLLVLRACRTIPFGQTSTYQDLALRIGRPQAVRAVARALASNPLPLVIPCHRVIRKDGTLGSYSAPGGLALKKRLLALERQALMKSPSYAGSHSG